MLVDHELYPPRSWTGSQELCTEAGIPENAEFATKPVLAKKMIHRAMTVGLPSAGSVTSSHGQAVVCLSVNEIRQLHAMLSRPAHPAGQVVSRDRRNGDDS